MPKIILPTNPIHYNNYSLVYTLHKGQWHFMGWRCHTCDKLIKTESVLITHPKTHTIYKRLSEDEQLENVQIITVDRKPWVSLGKNQDYQSSE